MAGLKTAPRRGDVYWVALDPTVGSEIRKTRPAVVVSNNSCNRYGARVLGDQLRSIDRTRLRKRIASLRADEIAEVDEALRITLDLNTD